MYPIFIVGSTGTGKTQLSLELAHHLAAEIINADSMQLYQGMDIGTAKLPVHQRRGIEHHLLDIWSLDTTASVARYQEHAKEKILSLLARGIWPIIVGGSMMYVQSVIDQWEFPHTSPQIRAQLEQDVTEHGLEYVRAQLFQCDPDSYHKILPTDTRRIIRALEVNLSTGKKFQSSMPYREKKIINGGIIIGLDKNTEELDHQLMIRTSTMFEQGLVSEVEKLLTQGLNNNSTAAKAIGYSQVISALQGKITFTQAQENTLQATKRYVRRQRSWFAKDPRIHWIDSSLSLLDQCEQVHNLLHNLR